MKNFILVVLALLVGHVVLACDACGCSSNGDGWGIMPNYNRHFAGMRFHYRHYHNEHPMNSSDNTSLSGDDHFYRADLQFRYTINRRFQIATVLPYRFNNRTEGESQLKKEGIGDVSVQFQFLPVLPGNGKLKHALQLTGGIEAPTGKFKFSHEVPVNMQMGSGSWDYLAGLSYTIRHRNIGFNAEGTYRMNGYSKSGYDWGNSYTVANRLFYNVSRDSSASLLPWIGMSYEHYESNIENMKYQIRAAYSSGELLLLNGGIDYFNNKVAIGAEFGIPLINAMSEGYSAVKINCGIRLLVFINPIKKQKTFYEN
jgi:hypothetical protein